jgi:hypothetical protein
MAGRKMEPALVVVRGDGPPVDDSVEEPGFATLGEDLEPAFGFG